MRLLFLIFLIFPMALQADQYKLIWPANPISENVTDYNVYINETVINTKLTEYVFEGAVGDCLAVSAINLTGESGKTDQVCLPSLPSIPGNGTIKIININIVVK